VAVDQRERGLVAQVAMAVGHVGQGGAREAHLVEQGTQRGALADLWRWGGPCWEIVYSGCGAIVRAS
jgi:hypothetical protein